MPSRYVNRKSDLERHVWYLLERDNTFFVRVKPNNRIKMFQSKDGNPEKGNLSPADLQQVSIKPGNSTHTGWDDTRQETFGHYGVEAYTAMNQWVKDEYRLEIMIKADGGIETDECAAIEALIRRILFDAGPKLGLSYVTRVSVGDVTTAERDEDGEGRNRVKRRIATIPVTVTVEELYTRGN